MATNGRTQEQVTREIAREREQLAAAVQHLRGELKSAADVKSVLKAQAPKLALVAAVYVGYKVVKFMAWQKARSSAVEHALEHHRERFSFGRFTLIERD
jgi:hypothetical protein